MFDHRNPGIYLMDGTQVLSSHLDVPPHTPCVIIQSRSKKTSLTISGGKLLAIGKGEIKARPARAR
jgi:hypothetical protein